MFHVYSISEKKAFKVYSILKENDKTFFLIFHQNLWRWVNANEFEPV